jgi:hypothetical protein
MEQPNPATLSPKKKSCRIMQVEAEVERQGACGVEDWPAGICQEEYNKYRGVFGCKWMAST